MRSTLIALLVAGVCAARVARADTTSPWAQGVSQETQDQANALYEEGNALFAQQAHAPAVEKYKAALALWNHPLIRFNLAVTEVRLDRPLEAADDLEQALRFGAQPFDEPAKYQSALDYQALLKGRVGYLEASCKQKGARVMIDGKPWFICPGKQRMHVMAGEHGLFGEQEDFVSKTRKVVVAGGTVTSAEIEMTPLANAVILKYPYGKLTPWVVTGAGIAVAIGGLTYWLKGRSDMDTFHTEYLNECQQGCEKDLSNHRLLADQRDSAELKGKIGITMMIVGGATTITGAVFTILNRPARILPVEVSPTPGGAAAVYRGTF